MGFTERITRFPLRAGLRRISSPYQRPERWHCAKKFLILSGIPVFRTGWIKNDGDSPGFCPGSLVREKGGRFVPTALSRLKIWVKGIQFDSGFFDGELPINAS